MRSLFLVKMNNQPNKNILVEKAMPSSDFLNSHDTAFSEAGISYDNNGYWEMTIKEEKTGLELMAFWSHKQEERRGTFKH